MANEKVDLNQWFLRIAGGTVFGPVSTKGLIVWAEQGRIVPGNEVSNDRETWISAETVPELEMDWYVNAGAKTEGPFNRNAAETFLKSGKAPSGAKLIQAKEVDPARLAPRTADPAESPDTLAPAPEVRREASAPARQAGKSQGAIEDERDALRKQMQELQAQLENVRANAEKDAQKRERKLDGLKQEVTRLRQEQEEAASHPMLELIPEAGSRDAGDDSRQAMEELRRQAEDERRVLDRDAEVLRARIQQLEKDLADAQAENKSLLAKMVKLDKRAAELASQVGQLETERHKVAAEREKLQQQLGVAMSAATDATNEAANGELRRRVEQLEAVTAGLRTELAQTDQALTAERAAIAELLASSNERDLASRLRIEELETVKTGLDARLNELGTASEREARLTAELATARSRIAELQGRLARLPEHAAAAAPEAEGWLRQFATDELTTLDKALHEERQSFNDFKSLSAVRQETIQSRIQAIQRLLSGNHPHPDGRRPSTAAQRMSGLDPSRMQNEVDLLREEQQKETKHFEEREAELLRRVRVLETEETRLRSLLEATDMEGGRKFELMETIRRREQELAQERRIRDQDREQFQATQQALHRRIEELERAAGISPENRAGDIKEAAPGSGAPRRLASFGAWLKR
ncbi:MAG: hypothetical protein WCI17_00220 [bacterium]